MKKYIKYINNRMERLKTDNISIHTGKLSETQINTLKKHFKITREYFGYTKFEKQT